MLQILPYGTLLRVLDMPTIRDLEDLIIDAIYLDIVRGKLDQRAQQFEVEYTMGRDLEPGKLEQLLVSLQNWYARLIRSGEHASDCPQGVNDIRCSRHPR